MSDRELLELAAKAAGLTLKKNTQVVNANDEFIGVKVRSAWNDRYRIWNPLTDDGDALRLAVRLRLDVEWLDNDTVFVASAQHVANNDPYAATRRAIVRAAAEIGRTM